MHLPPLLLFSFSLVSVFANPQAAQNPPISTQYTDDTDFQRAILNSTNLYRRQHNATELSWNTSLAELARDWSDGCEFEHSGGPAGENLAAGYPNATAAVEAWGDERGEYDFGEGEFAAETGHFTQLVWRNTTTIGCARTECNGGEDGGDGDAPGWYIVCEYHPAGNVIGQFTDNVQEQLPSGDVPSATAQPAPSETAQGGTSRMHSSVGALWVALFIAFSVRM
ncbi:Repressed by EFG1 protein 1 [Stagonosporopsis vannaccii]|nr:Repressed by EFG1 protein 1 [Stagonosporopsis vannaccii]